MKTSTRPPHANRPHKSRGIVGVLAAVGLILIIPLLFVTVIRANVPAKQPPAPPATPVPGFTPGPEHTPAPTAILFRPRGAQPPPCTFPLPQTTTTESASEAYTFSDPQVVASDSSNLFQTIEWLPDNQRVLITRDQLNNDNRLQYESIELLDPRTGETQVYATSRQFVLPPLWLADQNAVLYQEAFSLSQSYDSAGVLQYPLHIQRQLWISRGAPPKTQLLEDAQLLIDRHPTADTAFSVAVDPDGSQIVYADWAAKQFFRRRVSLGSLQPAQAYVFDAGKWDYRRPDTASLPVSFHMAWRPNATQIFLYNGNGGGNYTFLFDANNEQVCELNLFGPAEQASWAMTARWSPDGRYLAVVRTKGVLPIDFSDLIVLDTATGKSYEVNAARLSPPETETKGQHFVQDIAWAPDNRHLAVIGLVDQWEGGFHKTRGLYLVDFLTGASAQIAPLTEFGSDYAAVQLAWSNDGSNLLVECPTRAMDGLCLLSVQKDAQP